MTTAREICTDAIEESGVIGTGQTPLSDDIDKIFRRLQRMIMAWNQQRWLVPSLQRVSFIPNGAQSYTIGLGGTIDIVRPNDIKAAYVVQRNTGSNPVSLPLTKIFSYENYALIAVKNLASLPDHFFYDAAFPLANFFPIPIPSNQYEISLIIQNYLGFGSTIKTGNITVAGSLYTNGVYNTVSLTGGTGTGAVADITVTGGVVTLVNLSSGGQGYALGDVLSAAAATIGGTGSGFTWTVDEITSNLDTELIMPSEYEEAVMYNLTLRACSYFQVSPTDETKRFAKSGLNYIRKNNTQIPTLQMPNAPGLRKGRSFSLYNPDR